MANNRISRDLDDRLQGRVEEIKERQALAASSPEEAVHRERLEAFRDKWANNALPDVSEGLIPGMHLCWLSTTNQYDSIDKRMALGYEPVKVSALGKGFDHLGKMSSGRFEGCVSCNEMVLFMIPEDIYQEVAKMLHFDEPMEHQRNITAQVRSAADPGKGGRSILEGGLLEMEKETKRTAHGLRF